MKFERKMMKKFEAKVLQSFDFHRCLLFYYVLKFVPMTRGRGTGEYLGWFKMHEVFRYWLPGQFWEGLYVK